MAALLAIIVITMILIAYHDFKYREISVVSLSAATIICLVHTLILNGWKQALAFEVINIIVALIQFLGITIYFSLKNKKLINIINTYFGSGDIWFYMIITLCFSPLNFILFNLGACLIMLITYFIRFEKMKETVPFAGYMALMLTVALIFNFFQIINVFDDFLWLM